MTFIVVALSVASLSSKDFESLRSKQFYKFVAIIALLEFAGHINRIRLMQKY